jgi:hypothetical protein
MPVGGDVTAFSFGLMARYDADLAAWDWPWWIPEWGFGFPGVAESQMGAYYPPHLILYGFLPPEAAYTASLVLHLIWGMAGALWLARRMGVSAESSFLVALAWGLQGFTLAHLPHHWSYTVGGWLPWAWGLAWGVALGERPGRDAALLGLVLTLQILPGHFQLAFITQGGVAVFAAVGIWGRRGALAPWYARLAWFAGAGAMAVGLAAAQWVPTLRLARLTEQDRSFEYLSGFAGTPVHLVNYVAPLLFHRSPLWRPIAWDPFHTSPEEWQPYLGLLPLFLALGAIVVGFRTRPEIRLLTIVSLATLLLSLGPYIPGFRAYCQLPGFSFFRAPARWSLATATALAVLAGFGLDLLRSGGWKHPRPALIILAFASVLWPLAVVGFFEALKAERPNGGHATAVADVLLRRLPWGEPTTGRSLAGLANRPLDDLRIRTGFAELGWGQLPRGGARFDAHRWQTYRAELLPLGLLAGSVLLVAGFVRDRRWLAIALTLLAAADLIALGRHRAIDSAPLRPLAEQSAVLQRLADELPAGSRVVDPLQNLPIAAGLAPVLAYRTLDLPVPGAIVESLRRIPPAGPDFSRDLMGPLKSVGARARVLLPDEFLEPPGPEREGRWEFVDDPVLMGWLRGPRWVDLYGPNSSRFLVAWAPDHRLAAWRARPNERDASRNAHAAWKPSLSEAEQPITELGPGQFEVAFGGHTGEALIVPIIHDPQWRATLSTSQGRIPLQVESALGGWLSVVVPVEGPTVVHFQYEPDAELLGLWISVATLGGLLLVFVLRRYRKARRGKARSTVPPSLDSKEAES